MLGFTNEQLEGLQKLLMEPEEIEDIEDIEHIEEPEIIVDNNKSQSEGAD